MPHHEKPSPFHEDPAVAWFFISLIPMSLLATRSLLISREKKKKEDTTQKKRMTLKIPGIKSLGRDKNPSGRRKR